MKKKTEEQLTYEEAIQELEAIVVAVKAGTLPLDELTQKVARAKILVAYCQQKLRDTKLMVEEMLPSDD